MTSPDPEDDLFMYEACRNPSEVAFTVGLNARARAWLRLGVVLIGPVVQQCTRRILLFFLDAREGELLRVECHADRIVIGADLTGQGGPDLDPSSSGVSCLSFEPGHDLATLWTRVADDLDARLGVRSTGPALQTR